MTFFLLLGQNKHTTSTYQKFKTRCRVSSLNHFLYKYYLFTQFRFL